MMNIRCDSGDISSLLKKMIAEHPDLLPISTIVDCGSYGVVLKLDKPEQVDQFMDLRERLMKGAQ